jgi:NTE family protein
MPSKVATPGVAAKRAAKKTTPAPPASKSPQPRRRIALACQGGGSQTAFTAGALRGLFEAGILDEYELVSISGTSGGSICAALTWYALMHGDEKPWERMYEFWRENAASSEGEKLFNRMVVQSMRLANAGRIPSLSLSPTNPIAKMMFETATVGLRPLFTDFQGLLEKHIDFAKLKKWGARPDDVALMIGAVNVLTGRLAKFCSAREPIRVEHILASCAVPSIFPAVEFDGGAYWDGLFSDNPPISELLQPRLVGLEHLPQEIWVIKINATGLDHVPDAADQIVDRRNELVGNVSLFQQLDAIRVMNELYLQGAFTSEFSKGMGIDGPICIPKSFEDDEPRGYHIPFIEMSAKLSRSLDYESKIDRSVEHIEMLMKDGEQQASEFLTQRRALAF